MVAPSPERSRGQREGERVGETKSGGARCAGGGVAEVWVSVWGKVDAPSQIPGRPYVRDLGEEVGRSLELVEGKGQCEEILDEEAAPKWRGGQSMAARFQQMKTGHCRTGLKLNFEMVEGCGHGGKRMVPVQ